MIKIYDSSLNKYITVASNRGDKLYTKTINFNSPELPNYDNDESIITIDEALTSISKEIKENKEGIAWIYKNGTLGGGGGTGSGVPKFKVNTNDGIIDNDSIIVNNNQTLNLTFSITGTNTGRKMNISIKDNKGNYYGYNNSTYTVTPTATNIQIPNITENIYIEFTGYDQETLSIIESYTLNIRVAELKISGEDSVEVSRSDDSYILSYNVKTTYGQNTYVKLSTTINDIEYIYQSETFIDDKFLSVDIFNIFDGLNLSDLLKTDNNINNIEIKAEAFAGIYKSEMITSIIFTSENKISIDIVPLSAINNEKPTYEYIENDNIIFTIKLYFSNNEFLTYYKLYQINDDNTENIIYSKGDINNPSSNDNKLSDNLFYSKSNPITIPYQSNIDTNKPVYVYVKAWDKLDQQYTGEHVKWFAIKSDKTWQPYNLSLSGLDNHIDGGLNYLYYEWNAVNLNNINISDIWRTERIYSGAGNAKNVQGYIKYFNANNITNGIILRNDYNLLNTFRMSSNSYAVLYDNNDNEFMPFYGNDNWMNNPEGWTISLSFKSDIQSNKDNVIFSYATFTNTGNFNEGIYITTEDVKVRLRNGTNNINKWNISAKLTQNTLNFVDIIYKPMNITVNNSNKHIGILSIYINGVLSASAIEDNINFGINIPNIDRKVVLGATYNKTIKNNADVDFYRILFYRRALTPYHIIKNFIQGKAEIELLPDGNIDKISNNALRSKNFFLSDGKCSLIDIYTNDCPVVDNLYTKIVESGTNPLPVVLIKVDDSNFRNVVNNRYTESQVDDDKKRPEADKIITKAYNSTITINSEKSNKKFIMGSGSELSVCNDFSGGDCTVKLQGTSTLGNKSKNFEISFGANNIQPNLVQPFENMLPENSWILKADVMDSGHANNAAIGSFINNFLSTYKTTANQRTDNNYANELKATTQGKPVMLFIQYGNNGIEEFQGIYSFNMGRISYYNLGYQIFDGTYKVISDKNSIEKEVIYENHKIVDTTIEFPAFVSSYKSIAIPYNSDLAGIDSNTTTAVCYECNANNNIVGTFQQSNETIINEFYNRVYPETDNNNTTNALNRFKKLFIATSNLYECDPEYLCKLEEGDEYLKTRSNYLRDTEGRFYNTTTNLYEQFNKNNIDTYKRVDSWGATNQYESLVRPQNNANEYDVGLNWEYASAYFTLAMLFGLTDSLGKNLNIRSFDLSNWYISFYDMDTGLGLTNAGYETVKKDVYLDKFGVNSNGQSANVYINGYNEGGYDTRNSRLFNIIRFFTNKNYVNVGGNKPTTNYRKIWEDIRKTYLKNPDQFIDNYYIAQNKNVGELLFNYDYDIKYINDDINLITNPTNDIISSINFLHGNRVNFVRDWFTKHVYFLDGVFDIKCQAPKTDETTELFGNSAGMGCYAINPDGNILSDSNFNAETPDVVCPYINFSVQNDRVNPVFDGYKPFKIQSTMPMFFQYNIGTNYQRIYIPENTEIDINLYFKSGNEQTMSFNYAPYLTTFDKFGTLSYVNITDPKLSSITKLDLSNTTTLSGASFNISKLYELKILNMNNTKVTGDNKLVVNIENSKKISYIDLRNSDVNSLILPGYSNNPGGSLEEIYIDNTYITRIDLTGHTMLKSFSANNCENLESITFRYNTLLKNISSIPNNLSEFTLDECNSIEVLRLNNMLNLSNNKFYIGKNENLKIFEYSSNINATDILTELDLSGCPNIESINLTGFKGDHIILNINTQNTLKSINFGNSNISYIIWKDTDNNEAYKSRILNEYKGVLDFKNCDKLINIDIQNNKNVKYLLFSDKNIIDNFNISYCDNLIRVVGKISIPINKFINIHNFRFNELCKYNENDTTSNIILDEDGNVQLEINDNIFVITAEDNEFKYIDYNINNLLTHYTFILDDTFDGVINNVFEGSGINISDVYAILAKLPKDKITEFNNTFKNCLNIKTAQYINTYDIFGEIKSTDYKSNYNIERNSIKLDIFSGYNSLRKLNNTFNGCKNIHGFITHQGTHPIEKNSIYSYIPNLISIDNVFTNCGSDSTSGMGMITNQYIFYDNKLLEEIISPFSEHTNKIETTKYTIDSDKILCNCSNIKTLKNIFNNTPSISINFKYYESNGIKSLMLFHNNPKLENITNFLSNYFGINAISGNNEIYLYDVFGGYRTYKEGNNFSFNYDGIHVTNNTYPQKLKNLDYAFAITRTKSNDNQQILNWDNLDYIFYNQMPENISNNGAPKYIISLESCAYMFDGLAQVKTSDDDGYYNYTTNNNGTIAKFPINMFNIKHIDEEGKQHDVYLSKLKSCEGLFKNAAFKDELKFPGNIFKYCDCNNLNLSHLLENTYMTPIKLVNINDKDENGDNYICFTNCKLGDISYMFSNCFKAIDSSLMKSDSFEDNYKTKYYKYDRGGLQGLIPNKFLLNASNNISNMSNMFEGCCHMGTSIDLECDASGNYISGTGKFKERSLKNLHKLNIPTIDNINDAISSNDYSKLLDLVELDENNNYIWNEYGYDGTILSDEILNKLNEIKLNNLSYTEAKHKNIENYIDIEWNIENDPTNNIEDNINLIYPNNCNIKSSLLRSYYDASYLGDQIINERNVKIYRIYYDADYDIKNVNYDYKLIENLQLWNCDAFTYLTNEYKYKHENYDSGNINSTKFISNYICPMDLFRYCKSDCNINSIFKNQSRFNDADKLIDNKIGYIYGMIGRIPPKLFKPLSNATSFNNVFENCKGIIPYAQSLDGLLYNFIFNNNTILSNLTEMFTKTMLIGHLSDKLFSNNKKLTYLNGIFKNSYMPEIYAINDTDSIDYINFINSNTFKNNIGLINISNAFSRDNIKDNTSYIYFDINSDLFTFKNNPNLQNVSSLFQNQEHIQRNNSRRDEYCNFLEWKNINTINCYSGANFNMDLISKEMGGNKE